MKRRRLAWCAAAVLAAAGGATATPLRLDYCMESLGGGTYQYVFTLTLDNHDNTWAPGQGWRWFIFGDRQAASSPLRNFVGDPASLPVGPWTAYGGSQGFHNGPTFSDVLTYWVPSAVGESLTWRGTSTAFLEEPTMLFSTLAGTQGGGVAADFEPAHRVSCGVTQGACCRPDGSCIVVSSASCTNEGGIYRGDNTACPANCPQPPTGACCLDTGCSVLSQARCTALGGTYRGDNSPCGTAGCAAATAHREVGDAGDVPATAKTASGTGPLTTIYGSLHNFSDADMYRIRICEPANFSANVTLPGFAIEEIFLFRTDGTGIASRLAFNGPATLTSTFTASLPAGEYFLAVAAFLKRPMDASGTNPGAQLWLDNFDNIERAPDGPAAANPIDHWDQGGGSDGDYVIALTGACFVAGGPAPCYPDCNGDHLLNVNDFVCFQGAFAGGNLALADCTRDNTLNVNDFVCFQSAFAAGCSAP